MTQNLRVFLGVFLSVFFLTSLPANSGVKDPKVVVIALDGVRQLEIQGKALDDNGRRVSAKSLFPNIMKMKKKGVYFSNMRLSNPVGISLPAYSDMFVGRRHEKIVNNRPASSDFYSDYPTIFEAAKKGLKPGNNNVALISSWGQLCPMATQKGSKADIYKDCGWEKGKYLKPEVFKGSKADMDTFLVFAKEVPKRHPRFVFVHFGDGDEEAHLHKGVRKKHDMYYGIHNYHKALREEDNYIGRMWKILQSDPFYKDSTYLIVTTDHGRDNFPDKKQWWDHGHCIKKGAKKLCSGCNHVFTLVIGPGIKKKTVSKQYTHADLAPTVAKLLGVPFPSAKGKVMTEVFENNKVLTKR